MEDNLRRFINNYSLVVIMSLDQDFIAEAKRLHGWDISFDGKLYTFDKNLIVKNGLDWIERVNPGEKIDLSLGLNDYNTKREYDLVCLEQKTSQTVAVCQASRFSDYHSELLEGVILNLKQFQKGVEVRLNLPTQLNNSNLNEYINNNHIDLLKYDHPDYFGGEWHIFTQGSKEIVKVISKSIMPQGFN